MVAFKDKIAKALIHRLREEHGAARRHYLEAKDFGGLKVADVVDQIQPAEVDEFLTPAAQAENKAYPYPIFSINQRRQVKTYCSYNWDNGGTYSYMESTDPTEAFAQYVSLVFAHSLHIPEDSRHK